MWKLFLLHDTFCSRVQVLVLKSFVFFFFFCVCVVVVIIFSLPYSKEIGLLFFFFFEVWGLLLVFRSCSLRVVPFSGEFFYVFVGRKVIFPSYSSSIFSPP